MLVSNAATSNKIWIPDITDEELALRAQRIKPVIRRNSKLFNIKLPDLKTESYIWDPVLTDEAPELVALYDFTTYHTWAYYGSFKPTIAEVLAAIPAEFLDRTVAFEMIASPETADDLNKEREALNAGYNVAIVRLYAKA